MTSEDIVKVLSSSLGQDKAKAAVTAALRSLGLSPAHSLSSDDARNVLDEVGKEGGLVAAAAKIAGMRLESTPR